jgi:hypothetical protein
VGDDSAQGDSEGEIGRDVKPSVECGILRAA